MLNFTLPHDNFNLVRVGRKRSVVCFYTGPIPTFRDPLRLLHITGPMTIEADVTRFTVTTIDKLTQEDAAKAGYLYLHRLQEELVQAPDVSPDTPVTIFEFRCEGDG